MELLNIQEQLPIDIKNIGNNNIDNQPFDRYFQSNTANHNGSYASSTQSHSQPQSQSYSNNQEMSYYDYNFNTNSNQPIITPTNDSNSILEMSGNGSISDNINNNNSSSDIYNSPYTGIQPYPSSQLQQQNMKQKYITTTSQKVQTTPQQQYQTQLSYLNNGNGSIVPQLQQPQLARNEDFGKSHLDYQQHTHPIDDLKYRSISQPIVGQIPQSHLYSLPPTNHPNQPMNNSYQLNPSGVQQYPDMTTLVNSNSNIVVPLVESTFVDHRMCTICGKRITRDMSRHMRTHQSVSRFTCKFPKIQCRHKSGKFNRPYDYKKHLLNRHFKFDNPEIRKLHNLSDKLDHWGTCPCGIRSSGKDWLDLHILVENNDKKCPFLEC